MEDNRKEYQGKVQCAKCGDMFDGDHLVYIEYVGNVCDDCVENMGEAV